MLSFTDAPTWRAPTGTGPSLPSCCLGETSLQFPPTKNTARRQTVTHNAPQSSVHPPYCRRASRVRAIRSISLRATLTSGGLSATSASRKAAPTKNAARKHSIISGETFGGRVVRYHSHESSMGARSEVFLIFLFLRRGYGRRGSRLLRLLGRPFRQDPVARFHGGRRLCRRLDGQEGFLDGQLAVFNGCPEADQV